MMYSIIATTEITAAVFLVCIYIGMRAQELRSCSSRRFVTLCCAVLAFTLIDAASYLLHGKLNNGTVHTVLNALTFLGTDALLVIFGYYALSLTNNKGALPRRLIRILTALCAADALFKVTGVLTGKLFQIVDGLYLVGPWINYSGIIQVLCMCIIVVLARKEKAALGKRTSNLLVLYVCAPIAAALVEMLDPEWSFVYPAMCVATMIIYIFLQSGALNQAHSAKQTMQEIMYTDSLTGLRNRKAFDDMLETLSADTPLFLVFCDVNSLKSTNDRLGHTAGDTLLRTFAGLLTGHFSDYGLYRISGDEFLVVCTTPDGIPENRMSAFRRDVLGHNSIASFGYARGMKRNFRRVFTEAESEMYREKEQYYSGTEHDRRRKPI